MIHTKEKRGFALLLLYGLFAFSGLVKIKGVFAPGTPRDLFLHAHPELFAISILELCVGVAGLVLSYLWYRRGTYMLVGASLVNFALTFYAPTRYGLIDHVIGVVVITLTVLLIRSKWNQFE
jgi:hypothetical protein